MGLADLGAFDALSVELASRCNVRPCQRVAQRFARLPEPSDPSAARTCKIYSRERVLASLEVANGTVMEGYVGFG